MALGEAASVVVHDERAVEPRGVGIAQRAVEQDLAGGGLEEVRAANDLRDAHGVVIDHAGELVAGDSVAAPYDEVAEVDAGDEALGAEVEVVEGDHLAWGDAEAPVKAERMALGDGRERIFGSAGAGVDGFVVVAGGGGFMGRGEGGGEVFAGAVAGIKEAAEEQAAPGLDVGAVALALEVWRARTAHVWPLMPADAEPEEIFYGGGGKLSAAALGVKIFNAENDGALGVAGALEGFPEGAGVADVEIAGGRGRNAAAVAGRRRGWSDSGHGATSVTSRSRRIASPHHVLSSCGAKDLLFNRSARLSRSG